MSEPRPFDSIPFDSIHAANEQALADLAWAIELSVGEFSLHLVRCNYVTLQAQLAQRLQELCPVEIHTITLTETAQTLYTTLQDALEDAQPPAVMVMGMEQVGDLEKLFASTELVREEYRKNFKFPLILWLNDPTLIRFRRLAPNFASWAGGTAELVIDPDTLHYALQQAMDRLFDTLLRQNTSLSFPELLQDLDLGFLQRFEITAAFEDLHSLGVTLEPDFQADLDFARGLNATTNTEALGHFQRSLAFWEGNSAELSLKHGLVRYFVGRYRYSEAEQSGFQTVDWTTIQPLIQQSLEMFDAAQRSDLVAKSVTLLQRLLQKREDWGLLQQISERAIALHQTYGTRRRLSQDYGFLAKIALEQSNNQAAYAYAQQALEALGTPKPDQQWLQGLYLLFSGEAQSRLGDVEGAIASLERAKALGDPDYIHTYLIILEELRSLYWQQKRYLKAFRMKRSRLSIEQQYGIRAFVGAGRLQPRREEVLEVQGAREIRATSTDAPSDDYIAAEIRASGRYKDLEHLLRRITDNTYKLTVIYGDSGVGKSSLINAGLVPALKQSRSGFRDNIPVPIRKYTSDWMAEVADQLHSALSHHRTQKRQSTDTLKTTTPEGDDTPAAASSDSSLDRVLDQLRQNEHDTLRTILIFDQFEEFFFANPDLLQRRRFFEFLGQCLQIPFVKVFLSLREDYIHYLLECHRLTSMKQTGIDILSQQVLYELGDFTPADAKTIIQDLTQRSSAFHLDEALVDAVVRDLAGDLGQVRPIEMQIVGAELQTEGITTLEAYETLGDRPKEELVTRYLDEVVRDCGKENQAIAELILYLLTDERGTRPLKTRPELERDLAALISPESQKRLRLILPISSIPALEASGGIATGAAEPDDEAIDTLDLILRVLCGSGIVAYLPETPHDRYQLVHDYLAEFIRRQKEPQLKQLIADLEAERKRREAAEAKQKVLEVSNQKISRRLRAASFFLSTTVAATFISIVIALNTSQLRQQAEEERMIAQAGTRLERAGVAALNQYGFRPVSALLTAVRAGYELHEIVKQYQNLNAPEDYPAVSPFLALNTILDDFSWKMTVLEGHKANIRSANFSPDGQLIVTASDDGDVRLWDVNSRKVVILKGHQATVRSTSFSPNGQFILTASEDKTARIWDINGREVAVLQGHQATVESASFSPDSQLIVTTSADITARLWGIDGQELVILRGHQANVRSASFSPDGRFIVTASGDNTARLWGTGGQEIAVFEGHQGDVNSVIFSPDGQLIVTASLDDNVRLWDVSGQQVAVLGKVGASSVSFSPQGQYVLTTSSSSVKLWDVRGQEVAVFEGHQANVNSANFSPDGQFIVTASNDGTVRLWNIQGQEVAVIEGHQADVNDASFSPDGQLIVTASRDGTARLWGADGQEGVTLRGHQDRIWSASFSPDGQLIVTSSQDGTARLWDTIGQEVAVLGGYRNADISPDGQLIITILVDGTARIWDVNGREVAVLEGHQNDVRSASFSPDGQLIVTASRDGTARVWDVDGQQVTVLENAEANFINSASFSPDSQLILTVLDSSVVQLWDTKGRDVAIFGGLPYWINSASFSPDSQLIVTAPQYADYVRVWDIKGQEVAVLEGHQAKIQDASFSPDGQLIVTASADGTARLWDLNGREVAVLEGHQGWVNSASFSSAGDRIVTASVDGTARLWDTSGRELAVLEGHQGSVSSASFSPDGQRIITASFDGTARIWEVQSLDQLVARGCEWLRGYLPYTNLGTRSDYEMCGIDWESRRQWPPR